MISSTDKKLCDTFHSQYLLAERERETWQLYLDNQVMRESGFRSYEDELYAQECIDYWSRMFNIAFNNWASCGCLES